MVVAGAVDGVVVGSVEGTGAAFGVTGAGAGAAWIGTGTICGAGIAGAGAAGSGAASELGAAACLFGVAARLRCVVGAASDWDGVAFSDAADGGAATSGAGGGVVTALEDADAGAGSDVASGGGVIAADAPVSADVVVVVLATFGSFF